MANALQIARQHGVASTPEGVQDIICQELAAIGRGGACRGTPAIPESPYVQQDQALLADPRGPMIKVGTYGADARSWKSLHLRALDGILDTGYLGFFERAISCAKCANHFREWCSSNPFRPGDAFRWSVEIHNSVNRSLGISELTVEDARAIWSQQRA